MKNPLFVKCALLVLLGALLLIPLRLIEETIRERTAYRDEAANTIASLSAGRQSLSGPVLKIPVYEEFDGDKENRLQKTHWLRITPRKLDFTGALNAEKRAYGLYEVPVFEVHGTMNGEFVLPSEHGLAASGKNARFTLGRPLLVMPIGDTRGLIGEPKIEVGGQLFNAESGAEENKSGVHAKLTQMISGKAETLRFRIDFDLVGSQSFSFLPVGDETTAQLTGNWAHPSFSGDFLPRSREITENGFSAKWRTSGLASANHQRQDSAEYEQNLSGFAVRLIEPVDIYQQALRAVKYGILFIVLGFAAFFTFEHLKNLPIHPIQYLFIGLAQAVFFLLLTSLSEHIAFYLAYLAAASASIVIMAIYLAAVLQGWGRSLAFSSSFALLYAALFGILQSEQNAFLLGSLLIFVALSALMLTTRRLNWYQLSQPKTAGHA